MLEIMAEKPFRVSSPAFRSLMFPEGYYYYSGSAQKNLIKRIERHLRKDKIIHWHIDYLTSSDNCRITRIMLFPNADRDNECLTVNLLIEKYGLTIPAPGFGSSDCSSCISHLLYSPHNIPDIPGTDFNQLSITEVK